MDTIKPRIQFGAVRTGRAIVEYENPDRDVVFPKQIHHGKSQGVTRIEVPDPDQGYLLKLPSDEVKFTDRDQGKGAANLELGVYQYDNGQLSIGVNNPTESPRFETQAEVPIQGQFSEDTRDTLASAFRTLENVESVKLSRDADEGLLTIQVGHAGVEKPTMIEVGDQASGQGVTLKGQRWEIA